MKCIVTMVILTFFLCGFTPVSATPAFRVVTEVEVRYEDQDKTLTRTYTQDAHIRSVLNYLRMLHPKGNAIPDFPAHGTCQIILRYSSGPDSVIQQQDGTWLRRDNGPWQQIDTNQTQLLYPLLLLLSSDQS